MPGPWNTSADLLGYAADTLKVPAPDLPALWASIAVQAVAQAYGDLLQTMAPKGYTIAQLDDWDARVAFSNTQGLYRLGSMGGGFAGFEKEFFKQFDLTEFLTKFGVVTTAGESVAPGGSDVGGFFSGRNAQVDALLDPKGTSGSTTGLGVTWHW